MEQKSPSIKSKFLSWSKRALASIFCHYYYYYFVGELRSSWTYLEVHGLFLIYFTLLRVPLTLRSSILDLDLFWILNHCSTRHHEPESQAVRHPV